MKKHNGFTLIELVIFIAVLATGVGVLIPLIITTRYTHNLNQQTEAMQLAQQRMELILANERIKGFSGFSDPCTGGTPPTICTPPGGYTVAATIASDWGGDTNYKVITVSISGAATASLKTLIADYLS